MVPFSGGIPRSALVNLFLILGGAVVGTLLTEVLVRVAIVVLHRPPIVVSSQQTGWVAQPNLTDEQVTVPGGRFRLTTDRYGRRITGDSRTSPKPSAPTVLLVGDSFVFGLNVDDSETFAWRLARTMPDHRIVNLGVPGWGSDQELANLETFLQARPTPTASDIVVVMFENDFSDVQRAFDPYLGRRKPVFHAGRDSLDRGQFTLSPLDRLMDYSRLVWLVRSKAAGFSKPLPIDPDAGAGVVLASLSRIRRLGEAHGARVTIFAQRRLERQSTVSDSVWHDVLARTQSVDITDSIRSLTGASPIGFDGVHWSTAGNNFVASLIRRSLYSTAGMSQTR